MGDIGLNDEFDGEGQGFSITRELYDWVESGLLAVVSMVLIFIFVARMVGVEGISMMPTLSDHDKVIATHFFYTPARGDIIVITKPNDRNAPLVKRIIAIEGQTVDIDFDTSVVSVDGVPIQEGYIMEPTRVAGNMEFPATVPEGCVFAMGDNRNDSWDSRFKQVGMIDERYILGKIIYRITPYNKMGAMH